MTFIQKILFGSPGVGKLLPLSSGQSKMIIERSRVNLESK